VYILSTAHDDEVIEVELLRGEHEKIKAIEMVWQQ
jgi:hypothetical protein